MLSVTFSALGFLACLWSRRRGGSGRSHSRLLAFRQSLRGPICLAAVFRFGPGSDVLAFGWLVLNQRALALTNERELRMLSVPVDADQVAKMHLLGGQQVGQRIDHMPLNGSLQVPRAIPLVRSFLQQQVAPGRRHTEQELPLGRLEHALLHLP